MSRPRSDPATLNFDHLAYILSFMAPAGRPLRGGARNDALCAGQLPEQKVCKMQNQIEKQTIPTVPAIFVQGQGVRFPEVKRCGYCDRLVRWTLQEGRNVAVNCDVSRHQCLMDGTAKRKQPVRHARPSPDEVAAFLAGRSETQNQEQSELHMSESTRNAEFKRYQADMEAWSAQAEAIFELADAMLKMAKSNDALAESNRRLAKTYNRLARAMEREKRLHR